MKRLLIVVLLFASLVFAQSANAYLIKVQCCSPTGTCGSVTGQMGGSEKAASFTPLGPEIVPEASYAIYKNNDPVNGALGHTLKFTTSPVAWYGTVIGRKGYSGSFDLRFFSTTTISKFAPGYWYLFKGIQPIHNGMVCANYGDLLDTGRFSIMESTWASSTFGAVLANGDQWTLTTSYGLPLIPEPSSILAMFAGLSGLVFCRIKLRIR